MDTLRVVPVLGRYKQDARHDHQAWRKATPSPCACVQGAQAAAGGRCCLQICLQESWTCARYFGTDAALIAPLLWRQRPRQVSVSAANIS